MSDFTPETRNSAIWSGDSRKVANGKANEVILTKQGKMEIEDISHVEAVQMGHVMEPVIGRLAQAKLGVELTKIEESLTHVKHPWFKSHFDFAGKQGGKTFLVEAKNYNAATRNKFDIAGVCPPADMAQLVHEAAVFGVDMVYLAVLFGGQEFVLIPLPSLKSRRKTLSSKWQSSGDMSKRGLPSHLKTLNKSNFSILFQQSRSRQLQQQSNKPV
jgi:hypothetical protein